MIAERVVLFGVQDLKKGSRRVASEVAPTLSISSNMKTDYWSLLSSSPE